MIQLIPGKKNYLSRFSSMFLFVIFLLIEERKVK